MVGLPPAAAAAALAFIAIAMAVVALSLGVEWIAERRRRAETGRRLHELDAAASGVSGALLRPDATEQSPWVQALSTRLPQLKDVEHLLRQAHVPWTVSTYLLLTAGLAVATGTGGLIAFGLGLPALVTAVPGALLPYLYVRRERTKRMLRFEEQLPDAVELVGRALRAGHPLTAGLRMVTDEMADPIAGEFRQVSEEQRFGMPFEDAIVALADRVPLVDVRILVTAILIQREVGGNLAEILDKIAFIIRQRFTIRRQLRVITAEGRMSMWVLLSLPPGVGMLIFFMHPTYIATLFTDPIGHVMLWASLGMSVAGFLWIRKIVDIEI